ncbi:sepiapterin reductase a [Gadus macrocephalus]|uniref:sepiapterin reductase a n=1 Tax=Gadus macrocephalus TaxID=80720 RepID=UPI0028CB98C7|nr:sepiapterin reductase a [Gadus macrocephalus]
MQALDAKDLGRALCIITGASRGFGRTTALQISELVKPKSVLVLAARNAEALQTLQAELAASKAGKAGVIVEYVVADLGVKEGVESVVKAVKLHPSEDFDHLIVVNNAGSLGALRYAKTLTDMAEVTSYMAFNLSSAVCLTAGVLEAFPRREGLRRTVVNVSSRCALEPFLSWGLYCSGKAARDMMFKVLAMESPDLRVVNYSPGPLDTGMQLEARTLTEDDSLRNTFADMFSKGKLLTCEASCAKLTTLLLKDEYTSGAHVDFYDV